MTSWCVRSLYKDSVEIKDIENESGRGAARKREQDDIETEGKHQIPDESPGIILFGWHWDCTQERKKMEDMLWARLR